MEGQEFLITAVQEKIDEGGLLGTIKHLSRTDMIEPTEFPAVIVLEEPFDYSQEIGQGGIIVRKENYNLAIVIESVNRNDLTEDKYKEVNDKIDNMSKEVLAGVLERVNTYDKISNLRLGRGEKFDGTISALPVMWNVIPVEITLVN